MMNQIKDKSYDELLSDYNKKDKRLDKIIKQSDKQQLQVIKLNEELDEYKNHLEKKVDEKTKELQELNKNLEQMVKKEVEENRKKDQYLNDQAKFTQLGELIANIAHHWRQPLNAISTTASGMITMRELGIIDEDDENKAIDTILKTTQELSKVIENFQSHINEDKGSHKFILQEQLNTSLNIIESTLKNNNIEVIKKFPLDDIEMFSVANKLSQSILNILKNGQDALIKTDKTNTKQIIFSVIEQKDNIIITIEDNANGIDLDILPKIFDPYFTTKHQSKGTGLGLYSARENIQQYLNGKIEAENTIKGAKFILEIPKIIEK